MYFEGSRPTFVLAKNHTPSIRGVQARVTLRKGQVGNVGGADRRACFRAGEQPIIRASQGRGDSKELGQLPNVNADRTMNSRILGHPEVGRRQTGYPRSVAYCLLI